MLRCSWCLALARDALALARDAGELDPRTRLIEIRRTHPPGPACRQAAECWPNAGVELPTVDEGACKASEGEEA